MRRLRDPPEARPGGGRRPLRAPAGPAQAAAAGGGPAPAHQVGAGGLGGARRVGVGGGGGERQVLGGLPRVEGGAGRGEGGQGDPDKRRDHAERGSTWRGGLHAGDDGSCIQYLSFFFTATKIWKTMSPMSPPFIIRSLR